MFFKIKDFPTQKNRSNNKLYGKAQLDFAWFWESWTNKWPHGSDQTFPFFFVVNPIQKSYKSYTLIRTNTWHQKNK